MDDQARAALMQLVRQWEEDPRCQFCGAREDCEVACIERQCPECCGLGMVIDFDQPLGMTNDATLVYGGKACPRGCSLP